MSASKSEVRASASGNNPTNADALEFEFSSPLKIADKAVAEWAKRTWDISSLSEIKGLLCDKTPPEVKFVQSMQDHDAYDRLLQAVILADACGRDFDYAGTFSLLTPKHKDNEANNAVVLQIAAVYHELANRMPARPEIGPEAKAFGTKMADAIRQFPDGYAVCLEYPHLRVVADSGKIDLVQGSTNTVESQTAAGEISAPKVLNAYGFLAQEIRTVGRMVIVAFEMIGNRQISARSVLEMVRSEKAVIVGMSRPMCDAFEKLRVAVHEDFVRASHRVMDGINEAHIVGTDTEGMPGA